MKNMPIKKLHTANFQKGRMMYAPEAIVIHITEGTSKSAIKWCHDPKSSVSYHYIIDEDGKIIELVPPENTAWHAGLVKNPTWKNLKKNINPNLYTLSIALAGTSAEGPNLVQFITCSLFVKKLCTDYSIPIDEKHIVGHNEIRADKTCPSKYVSTHALVSVAKLRTE